MRPSNLLRTAVGLGCILTGTLAHAGTFKTKPANPAAMKAAGILLGSGNIYHRKSSSTINEPDLEAELHEPFYGGLRIQRRGLRLLLFKSSADKQQHDRLAIDMNADGTLAADEILDVSKPMQEVSLKPDGVTTMKGVLAVEQIKRGRIPFTQVSLVPTKWLQGTVRLGNKDVLAFIYDANQDGKTGAGDKLLIDVNDDNKMAPASNRYSRHAQETFVIGDCLYVGKEFMTPVLTAKNDELTVELGPYKGPSGKMAIEGELLKSLTNAQMTVNITPQGSKSLPARAIPVTVSADKPLQLPAGTYQMFYGNITGTEGSVFFRASKQLTIKDKETLKLTFAKPQIAIRANQNGRKLRINRSLTGKDGISYSSFRAAKRVKTPAPSVEVFLKGGDGKAIASGRMEYG